MNRKLLTALIIIGSLIIGAAVAPSGLDWYISNSLEKWDPYGTMKPDNNYLIEGTYNNSFINTNVGSIPIDRRLNQSFFYKECSHNPGDRVKYAGMFYGKTAGLNLFISQGFVIKRELC